MSKKVIAAAAFIMVIIAASVVVLTRTDFLANVDFSKARDYINSYGHFSGLVFILAFVLRTFLIVFPSSVMVILGGSLFGHLLAFLYSMIAVFLSASLAFFIGRYAGKDVVKRLLKGKTDKLDLKIEKHGFRIILLMRLSVIFPFDIVNYAAGLSKVRYRDFILGTMLGITPEVFSLTYLGSSITNPFSYRFLLSLALVLVTIVVPLIYEKTKNRKSS